MNRLPIKMSEAICRKIFKGVALAGAGVALGAAVLSFSLKKVSAASKKTIEDNHGPTTTKSTAPLDASVPAASSSSNKNSSTPPASASHPSSSSLKGSTSSLATIKSSSGRHPSSSSGLSRSGSSSWDLHGSAASLVSSSDYEYDDERGRGGGSAGSGPVGLASDTRPAKWNYNWDLRDPSFTNRARPKATRHLFFILHGHYISNGDTNLHFLSSLGKTQLELTGKRLVTLGLPFSRYLARGSDGTT